MHFLFSSVGSHGDVLPLLAIAQEMRARGHRATLVAGHGYKKAASASDVEYIPLSDCDQHQEVIRDKPLLSTRYASLFIARHSVEWNQLILKVIEENAESDLVSISSERPALWADLVAHRLFGVRATRALIDLPILPHLVTNELPGGRVQRMLAARADSSWRQILAERRMHVGWNHVPRIRRSVRPSIPTIALWPDWIVNGVTTNNSRRAFGFMPAPDLSDVATAPPPRSGHLVFVAGTEGTTNNWIQGFIETTAGICYELGREGVLVGAIGPDEPRLAGLLTCMEFAPLKQLLEGAAAIVHHGGIGTAAAALECGVPQIALPRVFMQPMNAEWLRRLGVCVVARPGAWGVAYGTQILRELIENECVRRRTGEIAHLVDRRRALQDVCNYLEEFPKKTTIGYRAQDGPHLKPQSPGQIHI